MKWIDSQHWIPLELACAYAWHTHILSTHMIVTATFQTAFKIPFLFKCITLYFALEKNDMVFALVQIQQDFSALTTTIPTLAPSWNQPKPTGCCQLSADSHWLSVCLLLRAPPHHLHLAHQACCIQTVRHAHNWGRGVAPAHLNSSIQHTFDSSALFVIKLKKIISNFWIKKKKLNCCRPYSPC